MAFLPLTVAMLAASATATALVSRTGPRPLLLAGGAAIGGDSGVAARLLNVGRQVGGCIGLAVLGTVAWTVVAGSTRAQAAASARPATAATWQTPGYRHALVAGFGRAFLVAAALSVLILVATITMIRGRAIPSRGSCQP